MQRRSILDAGNNKPANNYDSKQIQISCISSPAEFPLIANFPLRFSVPKISDPTKSHFSLPHQSYRASLHLHSPTQRRVSSSNENGNFGNFATFGDLDLRLQTSRNEDDGREKQKRAFEVERREEEGLKWQRERKLATSSQDGIVEKKVDLRLNMFFRGRKKRMRYKSVGRSLSCENLNNRMTQTELMACEANK
ncbi:hypothetical protein Nepgr_005025 [Nepenthes gracilis]|uniref:Uncharacterized protein n=1 Tax=Nepenthes gracilis TaxID=150966 RepID=A0AAD3S2X2_NEPGR|nr:hypothetical protein Nepgr_005025 [Nepenthes gracilis]